MRIATRRAILAGVRSGLTQAGRAVALLVALPVALPVALAGLAAGARAESADCTYLRVALSTPQRVAKAHEDAALQQHYRDIFATHLERAGFQVTAPTPEPFAWELFSQVELTGGGYLAWSYAFLPMPGVLDGAIEFPTFSVIDRERGERVRFTTYHGLDHFRETEYALKAAVEAERLASLYLPVARELCAKRELPLDEERARLERIRDELAKEIDRVRAVQRKRLELGVDGEAR